VKVLGIESSCDETAAAVVTEDGEVLSDVVMSQVELHAPYGGVVPELASRDHTRNVGPVVREALVRAGLGLADVDGVAVTNRPGLLGALLVGVQVAKGMAWAANLPFVGVDHLVGHLLAVFLRRRGKQTEQGEQTAQGAREQGEAEEQRAPAFPFVALLASGGHTALYRVDGPVSTACTELGATRDDAAGEAFDKVAKLLGLGYPGGPRIDEISARGDASLYDFVAPMATGPSLEFSFSGLKTKIAQLVARDGIPSDPARLAGLCASFQRAVTTVLADKLVRAAVQEGVADVVIGGGVAANRELRQRVKDLAAQKGLRAHVPSLASCTDNAAMIAYAGAMRLVRGERDGWDLVTTSQTALPRKTRKGGGPRV
jgi:N6-L-threonylcarbamoyladenine synthase